MNHIRTKLIIGTLLLIGIITGCAQLDKGYNASYSTNAVTGAVSTQLESKPQVTNAISFLGSLPIPYAGVIASVGGLLYTGYRSIRNRKALEAVVAGIDAGRTFLHTTPAGAAMDAKIKDFLIQHQEARGVLNEVSKVVNKVTGDTVPPA